MTLTKADLIDRIHKSTDLKKTQAARAVFAVLEIMKNSLESGEEVLISGFGKFSLKDKNERRGRNPATGNHMILDGRRVVTFRCSQVLKGKMNGKM